MGKVVKFEQPVGRLGDALSAAGIWWLEPGVCSVRIYPGRGSQRVDAHGNGIDTVDIGGFWELDFSWQDRSIGVALAVHFREPKRASSFWANAEASNRALLNIASLQGWRIIQPDPSEIGWLPQTVELVADALKGTRWATGGVRGGTRGHVEPAQA